MPTPNLSYWLATLYMPDIPAKLWLAILPKFSNIAALFQSDEQALAQAGLLPQQIYAVQHPNWQAVEKDIAWLERSIEHHVLTWGCASYPVLLRQIPDPPLVIFVRGNLNALQQTQLAIVGSRNASPMGLEIAESFASYLAKAGMTITSGLALGIDGASHRGALSAQGITIAVAGTGLYHCYPAQHRLLLEQICQQQGAVVSEFPLATPPRPWHFPRRNRIISGLSLGTLVVEAAAKSGSLSTVRHALEQGREIFAIPGSIHHALAKGCHALIRQGAKLVEKAEDILEELGALTTIVQQQTSRKMDKTLPDAHAKVLKQIGYEITSTDMIICRSGLTAGELSSILLILELHGYIQSVVGGYLRITPTNEVS